MTISYVLTQRELDMLTNARNLLADMIRDEMRSPHDVKALETVYWLIREATNRDEKT